MPDVYNAKSENGKVVLRASGLLVKIPNAAPERRETTVYVGDWFDVMYEAQEEGLLTSYFAEVEGPCIDVLADDGSFVAHDPGNSLVVLDGIFQIFRSTGAVLLCRIGDAKPEEEDEAAQRKG